MLGVLTLKGLDVLEQETHQVLGRLTTACEDRARVGWVLDFMVSSLLPAHLAQAEEGRSVCIICRSHTSRSPSAWPANLPVLWIPKETNICIILKVSSFLQSTPTQEGHYL